MSYEPLMDGKSAVNVYEEHVFRVRAIFGSGAVESYRAKDVTFARNSAGNYTITLPKPYEELTDFTVGFLSASGAVLDAAVVSETIGTDGKLVIEFRSGATATDPGAGARALISVGVSSSPLNAKFAG